MQNEEPKGTSAKPDTAGEKFMLQEHSRIIDAYYDLHVQKNELIKVYLTFFSLPATIVAIFLSMYKYFQPALPLGGAGGILQTAGVYLSILLVLIGVSVLQVILKIRIEQLLYVKTINVTRQYFKDKHGVDEKYLVLPSDRSTIKFGHEEIWGRAFWEAMIIADTSAMLIAFLSFELAHRLGLGTTISVAAAIVVGVVAVYRYGLYVKGQLRTAIKKLDVTDTIY